MKQKVLSLLSIATVYLMLSSCVKDAPIYPDDPGFVPFTGTRFGASTGTHTGSPTSTVALNGSWEATTNKIIIYDQDMKQTSISDAGFPLIGGVTVNDAAATANLVGVFGITVDYSYTSSVSGGGLQMTFDTQPYPILDNKVPVNITNATASSMTWMSIDPVGVSTGGVTVFYGYQTVFRKK